MKKNSFVKIHARKQYNALLEAKKLWKEIPNTCLEMILVRGLLRSGVHKEVGDELEDYFSFYNRENGAQFNMNPNIFAFDHKYDEERFFNFILDETKKESDIFDSCSKINFVGHTHICEYMDSIIPDCCIANYCPSLLWKDEKKVVCIKEHKNIK